jgi:hypothetical protein
VLVVPIIKFSLGTLFGLVLATNLSKRKGK